MAGFLFVGVGAAACRDHCNDQGSAGAMHTFGVSSVGGSMAGENCSGMGRA